MSKDLRYAIRTLLKRPGFLFVAVSTLALGIGATTAMFTVVNSVLLRPLNFPDPERIAIVEGINPRLGITASNVSVPDAVDWQQQSQSHRRTQTNTDRETRPGLPSSVCVRPCKSVATTAVTFRGCAVLASCYGNST